MSKNDKSAAHGLTRGDFKAMHEKQSTSQELKTIAANGKDAPRGYKIREDEKDLVHVELETPLFNQTTGVRLSEPHTQKYTVREFEQAKEHGGFTGYTVKVLHAPKSSKEELGSAVEGTRNVNSNYAAMQDAYEALTGERPDETYTEHQLDAALKTAKRFAAKQAAGPTLPSLSKEEALPNAPGLVVGSPAADGLLGVKGVVDSVNTAAEAAKATGDNTTPTADGTTSVGQETVAPQATKEVEEEKAPAGRRGARPANV